MEKTNEGEGVVGRGAGGAENEENRREGIDCLQVFIFVLVGPMRML